jgi:DtxR family Mn-dependent transcriptional regulator
MANRTTAQRPDSAKSTREQSRKRATEATDDYLKAIFILGEATDDNVPASGIAARLKISGASVTKMLQKLSSESPPLLIYQKHHGVRLSKAGRERALEIVRHHRLIETFLHQVLDYPWDEVHDEAERLEHFISEKFEARVAAKLNHPEFDPHGHPIPTLDGTLPPDGSRTLAQSPAGNRYRVISVSDHDPEMLRFFADHQIGPNVLITLQDRLPFEGGYRVSILPAKEKLQLSTPLASAIFVCV